MNSIPKPILLRLDPVAYEKLRQLVLRRDGWRCQSCGSMANLEIHHREFRSHSGHDAEENHATRVHINAEEMMHRTRKAALKADS